MKKIIYGLLAFGPVLALAQSPSTVGSGLTSFGTTITGVISNAVIPVLFAIAIVYFIWGVVKFIMSAGDDEARAKGKSMMIWGIVGLVVIVCVYGLIQFLSGATGLQSGGSVTLPTVQ
jgi:hypothetical protein